MMSEEMRSQQIEQKQIEKMAKDIYATGVAIDGTYIAYGVYDNDDHFHRIARKLYAAGYRKQSDVAKELINCILIDLIALRSGKLSDKSLGLNNKTYKCLVLRLKEIAAEYGVEVEK